MCIILKICLLELATETSRNEFCLIGDDFIKTTIFTKSNVTVSQQFVSGYFNDYCII